MPVAEAGWLPQPLEHRQTGGVGENALIFSSEKVFLVAGDQK